MLERQIMFKQLQELQRQKKLRELNDARQQNVLDQLSMMQNGVAPRDESQMFMFGNANLVPLDGVPMSHESACLFGPVFPGGQMGKLRQVSYEEFGGGQEGGWPGGNVGGALDPLEEKILFNKEDDGWETSFGKNSGMGSERFENMGDFPSLESGGWSALMQSAVAEAASGDVGVQEEWGGLSFQNQEVLNENQHSNLVDSTKHLTPWMYNNMQNTKLLNMSNPSFSVHGFPHFKSPKEEDMQSDSNPWSPIESGHVSHEFIPHIQKNFRASESASFISNDYSGMSTSMDRSAGFPAPNSSHNMLELFHKVNKEYSRGLQSGYIKNEPANEFTPLPSQYFGLKLAPPTQKPHMNIFDPSQISQEPGLAIKAFQERSQNYATYLSSQATRSYTGSRDGQQSSQPPPIAQQVASSARQTHAWVDSPSQHNPSGAQTINSQGFDDGKESFLGNNRARHASISARDSEAIGFSLKQANSSPTLYGNDARTINNSAQQFLVGWPAENLQRNSFLAGSALLSSPYLEHLEMANKNMILLKSKKRKVPSFERLPWHKKVAEGCSRPHDMSTAELEWAYAANRIPEKLKIEADEPGDLLRLVHPKRRFVLTTQLTQLLFRPAPDASAQYDIMTYYATKLALGDACSLASHVLDSSSGKSVNSEGSGDQDLSKTIEGIVDRSKAIEEELLRLENEGASSFLDIRVDFQDLEKFSVITRFARFHGRGPLVAADGASTMPKLYPQRYVTARPMPRTVPEGQNCLLL